MKKIQYDFQWTTNRFDNVAADQRATVGVIAAKNALLNGRDPLRALGARLKRNAPVDRAASIILNDDDDDDTADDDNAKAATSNCTSRERDGRRPHDCRRERVDEPRR